MQEVDCFFDKVYHISGDTVFALKKHADDRVEVVIISPQDVRRDRDDAASDAPESCEIYELDRFLKT